MMVAVAFPGFIEILPPACVCPGFATVFGNQRFQIVFDIVAVEIPPHTEVQSKDINLLIGGAITCVLTFPRSPRELENGISGLSTGALLGGNILAEAGLTFLGFGDPSTVSWGRIVNDGVLNLQNNPEQVFVAAFGIFFLVLAFDIVGDALRDAMDPRLRD